MNFKKYFEDTVSADIAQATPGSKVQRKQRFCECGGKLNEKLLCEDCGKTTKIDESAVGSVGRTGHQDALDFIDGTPELRKRFKKVVKDIGGVAVARRLLNSRLFGKVQVSEASRTQICSDAEVALDKLYSIGSQRMKNAIEEVYDLMDTDC